ncbi:MAG: response regulator [Leptolyngbya sp. SIO4C1]|nr:response regulator [Leptolyngbya sp. SIO4C1]
MRILIAEADDLTAKSLANILESQNYAVDVTDSGQAAWDLIELFDYDLVIAEVELPQLNGVELCKQLRSHRYHMPLLLTGKDSSHDKAVGLDAGADDYVVRPCDDEELMARVRALLRRASQDASPVLVWGALQLDPGTHEVSYDHQPFSLTPKESALLELLLRNPRRVFSCGMVLEHLWAYEDAPGEEAVRTHVKCIRQKLKAAGAPANLIETVYGIGYRLRNRDSRRPPKAAKAQPGKQQTIQALETVWQRFQPRMQEQIEVIERAITALDQGFLAPTMREEAEREAHSLAGALGTFGLPTGSTLARDLEHWLCVETTLRPQHAYDLKQLVQQLRQLIEQRSATPAATSDPPEAAYLLVIDTDQNCLPLLLHEARQHSYQIKMAASLSQAQEILNQQSPVAVVIDPDIDVAPKQLEGFIKRLTSAVPAVPVIVLTRQEGLSNRLKVSRLGISRFLHKPMPAAQILEVVNQVLQQHYPPTAKILIVDDDPVVLNTLTALLTPWGFSVTTLANPRKFLDVLNQVYPDLLILDIKMPHISGIELCQVVRNDPRWSTLPIIFLTAHTTSDVVTQVFTLGADDFVSKPVAGPELVVRILNRLERVKLLQRLANVDPLTGVLNRQKSKQELEARLSIAERYGQPFALAVIDLDQLRQINRQYSHETGDSLLRQFGRRLQQTFRAEDVIGRWGGEEFVVGMYGMTAEAGKRRLLSLLQEFSAHSLLPSYQPSIRLSFCAGIAHYPDAGETVHLLYQRAEQSLQQAKQLGRGHILAVSPCLTAQC